MKKIGMIGLGIMGKPMAKNLLRAGFALKVYDLNREAVEELFRYGAVPAAGISEAATDVDAVVTMLPNSPQVKEVALGPGGILETAAAGCLLIDMSSIAPGAAKEVAEALAQKGIQMVDAPVSGGEPKAVDGTLAIMAGGRQEDFDRALPVFEAVGSSAVLVGPIGSGNSCKLANQVIVACNIAALAEGLMLAKRAGADPEKVFSAVRGGLAGSSVMDAKAPMMLSGNQKPGFKIDLHMKDLQNALSAGGEAGAPLPLTALVMQMLGTLRAEGLGQADHSALCRYYEKLTGCTLKEE